MRADRSDRLAPEVWFLVALRGGAACPPAAVALAPAGCRVFTGAYLGYSCLGDIGRRPLIGNDSRRPWEWPRDDGNRRGEVQCNNLEGFLTRLRDFLRQARGVTMAWVKDCLSMCGWAFEVCTWSPEKCGG